MKHWEQNEHHHITQHQRNPEVSELLYLAYCDGRDPSISEIKAMKKPIVRRKGTPKAITTLLNTTR